MLLLTGLIILSKKCFVAIYTSSMTISPCCISYKKKGIIYEKYFNNNFILNQIMYEVNYSNI